VYIEALDGYMLNAVLEKIIIPFLKIILTSYMWGGGDEALICAAKNTIIFEGPLQLV
jgi:hypothetical protein